MQPILSHVILLAALGLLRLYLGLLTVVLGVEPAHQQLGRGLVTGPVGDVGQGSEGLERALIQIRLAGLERQRCNHRPALAQGGLGDNGGDRRAEEVLEHGRGAF